MDTDSNGRKAGKGALIQTELSATLGVSQDQTLFAPGGGVNEKVAGTLDASYYKGCGERAGVERDVVIGMAYDGGQVSPTLTANNANGAQRMPDKDNFNAVITNDAKTYAQQAIGEYKEKEVASSLKERDHKDATDLVVYGLDRASFNQGKNAQYDFSVEQEKAQTIVAKGPGGVLSQQ